VGGISILFSGGFFKSSTLVGRQYAYFLNANIQAIMCVTILVIPFLVYPLTENNTHAEWTVVFILWALLIICCGIYFALRGSGDPGGFTGTLKYDQQHPQEMQPMHTNNA
jgi:TRAP-type uncharacterized transport system fused permease subunit